MRGAAGDGGPYRDYIKNETLEILRPSALPLARDDYFARDEVQRLLHAENGLDESFGDPLRKNASYLAALVRFRDNADWLTIVEHDRAHAVLPITRLVDRFSALGWLAGGAAVFLVIVLWALLYRVTHERSEASIRGALIELDL